MKDKTLKVFTKEDIEAFKQGYFRSLGKKSVEARRLKYGKDVNVIEQVIGQRAQL